MTLETTSVQSVAAFICTKSWGSALPAFRIVGPAEHAGLRLIRGNQGTAIHPEVVSQADVVVIQRDLPRYADAYTQIIARARAEGKPVICDLDDLLLALPPEHPDRRSNYYADALVPTLRGIIQADAVTVTTAELCAAVREFNPNTWVLPNYLDDHLWTVRAQPPDPDHLPVTIGFMGGVAHQTDLRLILPVLRDVLTQFREKVRLKFWGCQPPPELADRQNVEFVPFDDEYVSFAPWFSRQSCDVFVAPLVDNLFNRCKSPCKFFEYSALGVPGIYSRLSPYERVITHRENGFLAATAGEWKQLLVELIENPGLRRTVGSNARRSVFDHWLLSAHAHEWTQAYARAVEIARARAASGVQDGALLHLLEQVQQFQREADAVDKAAALDAKDRELAAVQTHLDDITGSAGWRLLVNLRKMRVRLLPYGSRRERMLYSLWRQRRS